MQISLKWRSENKQKETNQTELAVYTLNPPRNPPSYLSDLKVLSRQREFETEIKM